MAEDGHSPTEWLDQDVAVIISGEQAVPAALGRSHPVRVPRTGARMHAVRGARTVGLDCAVPAGVRGLVQQ